MAEPGPFIFLVVAGIGGLVAHYYSAGPRRRRALARPFPKAWLGYLERNVPLYNKLPEPLQQELCKHIAIFLDEKTFEGCGGLTVTDEMRVTVAGQACILLLNRSTRHYPGLTTILLYPRAYVAQARRVEGAIHFEDERQIRLGESWGDGSLVLSWNDVARSSHDVRDGHNLVLHEFAHQLDQEDGHGDGVPILEQHSHYASWGQVLEREYAALVDKVEHGREDVLQAYGATNPAEFFAVATEAFFEKPRQLQSKHPELYAQLRRFYQLDPITWK